MWRTITDELDEHRAPIRARAQSEVATAWYVRARLGTRVRIGPAGEDGRVEVELRGHSIESLAIEIAGFATSMEVLDPPELRAELAAIGQALADGYESATADGISRAAQVARP